MTDRPAAVPADGRTLKEVVLACRSLAGIFELDADGRVLAFRRPCPDKRCCPRREGMVAVHRWPFVGGDEVFGPPETRYEPRKSSAELVGAAD